MANFKTLTLLQSALGKYRAVGDPDEADVIIGHSFGTSIGEGSVNCALAQYILACAHGRPIIADRTLADAFPQGAKGVQFVVEGSVTNTTGQGVGSWGTLVAAQQYMQAHGLHKPLMVAQSYHIGRVYMQGKKIGLNAVVPAQLPAQFDVGSAQKWTRSLGRWLPRELMGSVVLRLQKKL